MKLFDSELNVMKILWEQGDTSAKDIAAILEPVQPMHGVKLEPVHIKIASKIIAKVRFPKYRTSSLS